jgi:hypothetical protein
MDQNETLTNFQPQQANPEQPPTSILDDSLQPGHESAKHGASANTGLTNAHAGVASPSSTPSPFPAAPSHFLRPSRAASRPSTAKRPMTPLDREQRDGLVSCPPSDTCFNARAIAWDQANNHRTPRG